ncbi:MAG: E2/UBC family protein, partial [Armatimonadota bacterium]
VDAIMSRERVERELSALNDGGLAAAIVPSSVGDCVLYRGVPTRGASRALPERTDVLVVIPPGYPASMIDLAGLPAGSPLAAHVAGAQNVQGQVTADGRDWSRASYHPHANGGGPPWDPTSHGFHTYYDHLLAWLARLT